MYNAVVVGWLEIISNQCLGKGNTGDQWLAGWLKIMMNSGWLIGNNGNQ